VWLTERSEELGRAKAAKVEGRTAANGAVALFRVAPGHACIVEVNSETDFAAGSAQFMALAAGIAEAAAKYAAAQGVTSTVGVHALPIEDLRGYMGGLRQQCQRPLLADMRSLLPALMRNAQAVDASAERHRRVGHHQRGRPPR